MSNPQSSICRGCGAIGTIRAHIIPKAFATDAKRDEKHLVTASPTRWGTSQAGCFDDYILCGKCDQKLGDDDKYAVEMCRKLQQIWFEQGRYLGMKFDGERLARFANAVIWRASVSEHPMLNDRSLGLDQDRVKDAIFGDGPTLPTYLTRLQSYVVGPVFAYTYPIKHEVLEYEVFSMILGAFRWTVITDRRPLPPGLIRGLINGKNPAPFVAIDFRETTDYPSIIELVRTLDNKEASRTRQ